MSSYENIYEILNGGPSAEWVGHQLDDLTVDQRISAASVVALAAIVERLDSLDRTMGLLSNSLDELVHKD